MDLLQQYKIIFMREWRRMLLYVEELPPPVLLVVGLILFPLMAVYATAVAVISIGLQTNLVLRVRHSLSSDSNVKNLPGTILLSLAGLLFSPKIVEYTFKSIVADWHCEYFSALRQQRMWKARWVRVRYVSRFIMTVGISKVLSIIKTLSSVTK